MTDKTGNRKIRPPKLAITREMIEGGKSRLDALTAESTGDDAANDAALPEVTDDLLVAEIFLAMWNVYWAEVMGEQRKRANGNVITILQKGIIRP